MFQNTSRIENINGIKFYEQDVLYDDHIYTGDIELVINAQYLSPGFGIALLNNEGASLSEQKEIMLFKTGYNESSIVYKNNFLQKVLKQNSTALTPPIENTVFVFSKKGNNIIFTTSDSIIPLIEYTIPNDNWDKYSIGIYSNVGNIVKSINIVAPTPYGWNLNMHNTDGGYVKFYKSGFQFIDCNYDAEIEQPNIQLKAGRYYLKYEIDKTIQNDLKVYVFKHDNTEIFNKNKNILVDNNYFDLTEDDSICVKFSGRNGKISNIHICEQLSEKYIATKDENTTIEGSYITINLKNVEYVKWEGYINSIPELSNIAAKNPYIISTKDGNFSTTDFNISLNKTYSYTYDTQDLRLVIKDVDKNMIVFTKDFYVTNDAIKIFYNMDSIVTKLKLKLKNSTTENDYTSNDAMVKYVTRDINSPILIVDNENMPLDLSSSYRFVDMKINDKTIRKYIFTNVEREIFEPDHVLQLSKIPSTELNSITIYGVLSNTEINEDMIFANSREGIDDISLYSKGFIKLNGDNIDSIDYATGKITLDYINQFQKIVVDYLKKDSYCINYIYETSLYKVEISNGNNECFMLYDAPVTKNNILETEAYKPLMSSSTTVMKPINNNYIVIRKE